MLFVCDALSQTGNGPSKTIVFFEEFQFQFTFSFLSHFFSSTEANNDDFLVKSNEVLGSMLDEIKEDIYHAHRNRTRFWSQFSNHLRRPHIQRGNLTEQRIEVANGIFVQNGFSLRREYQDVVENVYNSTLHRLDFKNSGAQTMQYLNK